jgi:protein-ribulosamine 3-kinase
MQAELEAATGRRFRAGPQALASGGGFAACQRWDSDAGAAFVKIAPVARADALAAEADALRAIAAAHALRVPAVLGTGTAGARAFLALEWIDFGSARRGTEALLGAGLARLHQAGAAQFGWHRDNTIGATPQHNDWAADWIEFFARQRLGFQLDLAERSGHGGHWLERGRRLCGQFGEFFSGYHPQPSLLHGDLWGGNWAADAAGAPVIFDPASYYGDREADLAMTQLFGGFGRAFYDAYQSAWPLDPGAGTRRDLYNLYHVLNHLNLFGGGYRSQAEAMIERLLAATR